MTYHIQAAVGSSFLKCSIQTTGVEMQMPWNMWEHSVCGNCLDASCQQCLYTKP